MKALITLAIALGILWLAGVTVIAVWPVVANAPWEDANGESTAMLLCEHALERRMAAENSLFVPVVWPNGEQAPLAGSIGREAAVALDRLEGIIAAAEQDIATFCR